MLQNIMDAITGINTRLTTLYALTLFLRDLSLISILSEAKIQTLNNRVEALDNRVEALDHRVEVLDNRMEARLQAL